MSGELARAVLLASLVLTVGLVVAAAGGSPVRAGVSPSDLSTASAPATSIAPPRAGTPAATMDLTSPGVTPAAVSLAWTEADVFLFSSYAVAYAANASGPWTTAQTISTETTLSTAIDGLSPGATYYWMVTASGSLGATESSNVLAVTQPPVAALTSPQNTSTSVELNWTNNATYGGLVGFVSYALVESENGSPPAVIATYTNAATRSATVPDLAAGTSYSFSLNTTDCAGGCGTDTATLSVTQSNTITVGTAFPLAVTVGAARSVVDVGQLDAFTCTAAGGQSPFTYAWQIGNATPAAGNKTLSTSFGATGVVVVSCEVTDRTSSRATASVSVTVNPSPTVVVAANRTAADAGESIAFSCAATPGTAPLVVGWLFGDGTTAASANATHAYAAAGRYAATCSATDFVGVTAVASIAVNVSATLVASASATALAVAPATDITFTGTATNGSGTYANYTWSFGDSTGGTGASVAHAYAAPGNFTVEFRVSDSNGITASSSLTVHVTAIVVHVAAFSTSVTSGHSVTFNASAVGGAGGPYNFTWNFGDGAIGYGALVSHTYASAGTYSPTLTVTDRLGAATNVTLTSVAVSAPPSAYAWVTAGVVVLLALLVGAIVAAVVLTRRRREESASTHEAMARYVPPTDPSATVSGRKICPRCGVANLPIRRTCAHCGADLPRNPRA